MKKDHLKLSKIVGTALIVILPLLYLNAEEVVRPEEIVSKRLVVYDNETYNELAGQWKAYNSAYPSEYAYANWMYAARYAGDEDYKELLEQGLEKYPANPTILYLKSQEKHGKHDNQEGRRFLETAIALDPNYADPWFSLVIHYMDDGDEERIDFALRRILESGVVQDEVMDYCYNMLLSVEENAIIISNGDNDTYPIWILTRILKIRPDVTVANRSLLNTDWYPLYLIKQGIPSFIAKRELTDLRESIIAGIRGNKQTIPPTGPFGDTLILKIIESAEHAERPVYFAPTLYVTKDLKKIAKNGRLLGLVTLVTSARISYAKQLRQSFNEWLDNFRTGGLNSWRLRYSSKTDAGFQLISNYACGLATCLDSLKVYAPNLRGALFQWHLRHLDKLPAKAICEHVLPAWCRQTDIDEIKRWCKEKGIKP
ncbi:MAG: hypothetical protein GY839_15440 [candidate division Zixibacteria bacterium]|nr:hypothetical protein [candidate division Zixibacteria bacterium]